MAGSEAVPTERDGTLRFPSPESGQIWLLGPETGPETFLVVAGRPAPPPPPELAARIGEFAGGDRAATLDAVIDLLETEVGPVAAVEIDHRP
jgi:hypothetical protein